MDVLIIFRMAGQRSTAERRPALREMVSTSWAGQRSDEGGYTMDIVGYADTWYASMRPRIQRYL